MKKILCISLIFFISLNVFSIDFVSIDNLHDNGNYQSAYKELMSAYDKSSPDAAVIWRLGRELYEYTKCVKNKKDKLAKLDEAIGFLKPYYDLKSGDKRDRAKIIQWYAVLSSEKARTMGIKESLDNIPNLFRYCDDAIRIDSSYGDPYYLKGLIDDGLPSMFGGDKYNMSVNLSIALKCDPENYWYFLDGAKAYKNRNWSSSKKRKVAESKGRDDGSPQNLDDRDYAIKLLERAIEIYNKDNDKTKVDRELIDEVKQLLEKWR